MVVVLAKAFQNPPVLKHMKNALPPAKPVFNTTTIPTIIQSRSIRSGSSVKRISISTKLPTQTLHFNLAPVKPKRRANFQTAVLCASCPNLICCEKLVMKDKEYSYIRHNLPKVKSLESLARHNHDFQKQFIDHSFHTTVSVLQGESSGQRNGPKINVLNKNETRSEPETVNPCDQLVLKSPGVNNPNTEQAIETSISICGCGPCCYGKPYGCGCGPSLGKRPCDSDCGACICGSPCCRKPCECRCSSGCSLNPSKCGRCGWPWGSGCCSNPCGCGCCEKQCGCGCCRRCDFECPPCPSNNFKIPRPCKCCDGKPCFSNLCDKPLPVSSCLPYTSWPYTPYGLAYKLPRPYPATVKCLHPCCLNWCKKPSRSCGFCGRKYVYDLPCGGGGCRCGNCSYGCAPCAYGCGCGFKCWGPCRAQFMQPCCYNPCACKVFLPTTLRVDGRPRYSCQE